MDLDLQLEGPVIAALKKRYELEHQQWLADQKSKLERTTNPEGVELIKSFEGIMDGNPKTVNLDPYLCPAGYWTIGWGHVVRDNKGKMIKGAANKHLARHWYPDGITMQQAEELLKRDLVIYEDFVVNMVKVKLNRNQFSALVSFCFNLGPGNLEKSTLLKLLNVKEFNEASNQFKNWNKANGQVLAGLTRRREAEKKLFLKAA